ncbi:LemA family protein [Enterococcus plantarum]|uniref:LemA family protein n=1 Tax=Enterococcus plantarum TaxID=1077675 RepID=UPI00084D8B9F|nr:LemA family protein [Enterococcus plantarum]MBO0423436.1 LemA family protein [Enterococcus plantarum]MBO0467180.1 LemA family protein [Enterococcus plantarum]OEG17699.1 LemA family protein [Enterococcus plantarum]
MKNNKTRFGLIAVIVIVLLGVFGVSQYNGLAKKEQSVESQWSQVENVMQRRADLVPNLVNSVKGSMQQEQQVFGDIAKAREAYGSANNDSDKIKASQELDQSVGTLINVINENYPELKSNNNVQTLMTQLEGTENRISVERKRYNDVVKEYNEQVVSFPKNIFANMMGLGKKDYFKADPTASTVPSVNFDNSTSTSQK